MIQVITCIFLTPFILAVFFVPILAFFHGRVIDMPEEAMPANALETGGEVEHEVRFMMFKISEGYSCEASAGYYDWLDTFFRYRDEFGQTIQ